MLSSSKSFPRSGSPRLNRSARSALRSALARACAEPLEGRLLLSATVSSVNAPDVTKAGTTPETVQVVYNSDTAIDSTTVNLNNISVTTPSGGTLTVTGAAAEPPPGNNPTETVDYTVAPPAGGWAFANDGPYAISLGSSPVADTSANPVTSLSGSFNVTVPDTTPPTTQISAPNVTTAGGATETVTIVYNDPTGINTGTIGTGNITVSGPGTGPAR